MVININFTNYSCSGSKIIIWIRNKIKNDWKVNDVSHVKLSRSHKTNNKFYRTMHYLILEQKY